ncbi:MAG: hypothetical protein ACHQUC_09835 [Chlamydiales bacterium]
MSGVSSIQSNSHVLPSDLQVQSASREKKYDLISNLTECANCSISKTRDQMQKISSGFNAESEVYICRECLSQRQFKTNLLGDDSIKNDDNFIRNDETSDSPPDSIVFVHYAVEESEENHQHNLSSRNEDLEHSNTIGIDLHHPVKQMPIRICTLQRICATASVILCIGGLVGIFFGVFPWTLRP